MKTASVPGIVERLSLAQMANLSENDIDRLLSLDWSDDDKARLTKSTLGSHWSGLPTHLQRVEYDIPCGPSNDFIRTGIIIPDNSIVFLSNATGSIQMGWNRLVDATGKFLDDGSVQRADINCRIEGINAFCFTAVILSSVAGILINSSIPNWGASVDGAWQVPAGRGGEVWTAFNDSDDNNEGVFTQKLSFQPMSVYAKLSLAFRGRR
jgi:hypothetical protein